jgi:hypothetical protein
VARSVQGWVAEFSWARWLGEGGACPFSVVVYKGLSDDVFKLVFDGLRVDPDLTPEDLRMENGDSVDVMIELVGGMYVASSRRVDNETLAMESLAPDVDVTICIPGGKHVTVSIGAHRTFKEATALAALQLELEAAETQAAEVKETVTDIKIRMRVLADMDEGAESQAHY